MKAATRLSAVVAAAVLALAGCGERPGGPRSGDDSTARGGPSAFKACMVTDQGGIDDRSFNTLAWKGMTDARDKHGIKVTYLESQTNSDFLPNLQQFISEDCDLIVTVGFLLGDATKKMAEQHPDQNFAIVDFAYPEPIPNVKPLVFDTSQSAFLSGYLAAGISESRIVAEFGGAKIPPVTLYMDGFAQGVDHYNAEHGTDVALLGWNPKKQNGVFVGNFTDQAKGKTVTENLMRQGADVIFPLAGAVNLGAAAAAKDAEGVRMIWVDSDGCVSAPQFCGMFVTSALKGIDVAVRTAIEQAMNGEFSNEPFVGTLDNGGVGLAPFHEYADDVPEKLKQELDQVRQRIIDGEIQITSPSKPTG